MIDETGMRRLGMGALLGVTRGSSEPARFIVLEHNAAKGGKPLVFVGKGVTFDSGGISLKPGDRMADMKFDMSGAAAVIGAMQAVSTSTFPIASSAWCRRRRTSPEAGRSNPGMS